MAERRPYRPWHPVTVRSDNEQPISDLEIRKADCVAIQAVSKGIANAEQQKRAVAAVLHICGINNLAWMPEEHGGERDTTFAAGKQHIGHQLRKLMTHSISILAGEKNDGRKHDRRSGRPEDDRNADRAKQ
ncbi:hypothetical protein [Sinorhizobium meliloti]|uniref:Uncharacterized protein n=1 Tax=Rhizobium meliloti TaxID=382 RepID=A0A2J0Z8G5_RHIML|nr:hypothetical protein [Sinorhizobium meliloti]PJR16805.1 hypothetical protein CEJ86_00945 [Sinorhizobium meliloti]